MLQSEQKKTCFGQVFASQISILSLGQILSSDRLVLEVDTNTKCLLWGSHLHMQTELNSRAAKPME